ncbi:MAG: hypothetical protein NC541_15285 [bacterium]|nr:hypothetical protein [bacterium]
MIDRDEIVCMLEQIKRHPEIPWNTPDRELAAAVYDEVKKDCPEARLCDTWINSWIVCSEGSRQELLEMLRSHIRRGEEELEELREAVRQLYATEGERISDWLDGQIRRKREYRENRDYSDGISLCGGDADMLQLYKGIETVAEALGRELSSYQVKDRTEHQFRYGGVEICQLRSTEEVQRMELEDM